MGGSSKGAAPVSRGPESAGGPTPTLSRAEPFYPSYPSYTPQTMPGLTIPSDIATLRQAAMAQSNNLINRTPFMPRAGGDYTMSRSMPAPSPMPSQAPSYAPAVRFNPVNPEPVRNDEMEQRLKALEEQNQQLRGYREGGGNA